MFFFDQSFAPPSLITLEGKEVHHMHVMRYQAGDRIDLVNGKGQLSHASLVDLQKKTAQMKIEKVREEKQNYELILVQGLCRLSKLDWIVEKATELGATKIWVFIADRSEKKQLSSHQLKRLEQITISALKQCRRLHLPSIELFKDLTAMPFISGTCFYGALEDQAPSLYTL